MTFRPEDVDLASLVTMLLKRFGESFPSGYVRARTVFRDAIAEHLGCSLEQAEPVVETLVARGFVRPRVDPSMHPAAEIEWELRRTQ